MPLIARAGATIEAFRTIGFAAILAGLLAGALVTLLQGVWVEPLIRAAEAFEAAEQELGWAPGAGLPRWSLTALANLVLGAGAGFLLAGSLGLARRSGWQAGLIAGLVAYAAVVAAPALQLGPALPGAAAAPLAERQLWWLMTCAGTAAGLTVALLGPRPWALIPALGLVLVPQLVGAPAAPVGEAMLPPVLVTRYTIAVLTSQLAFWAVLGSLTGLLLARGRAEPGGSRLEPAG